LSLTVINQRLSRSSGGFLLQMLGELNKLLDRPIGNADARAVMPTYTGHNGFLNHVVVPLYSILKAVGCGALKLEQCVVLLLAADASGIVSDSTPTSQLRMAGCIMSLITYSFC